MQGILYITNGFPNILAAGAQIQFALDKIDNPETVEETDEFSIETYSDSSFEYVTDISQGYTLTASPDTLKSVEITTGSQVTGEVTSYTFAVTPQTVFYHNGYVQIILPEEIVLTNNQQACTNMTGMDLSAYCELDTFAIYINDAFVSGSSSE